MTDTPLMTTDTPTDEVASQSAVETPVVEAAQQQATEAAPTPVVEGDEAKQEEAKEEPQGAPEAYEAFTVPEGVELDAEVLGEFQGIAKELNLPQEAAQKVADLGVKLAQKWATESQEATAAMLADWKVQTETDKEIGGDALPANLAVAKKALDAYGSDGLRELLEVHRLGDNPEIVRFMVRAGKAISEDTFVAGGNTAPARKAANILFPNQN